MEQIRLADFVEKTEQEQISFDFRVTTMDFKKSDELGKFLEYRQSGGTDCDRCPLIWEVYRELWGVNDKERSGDTMNSVQRTLNKYLKTKGNQQLSKDAEEFLSVAFTIGNFIPVLSKTYKCDYYSSNKCGQSFNQKRNACDAKDYWDRTLYYIYRWYKAVSQQKKDQWLKKLLCKGGIRRDCKVDDCEDCIVVACENWLKLFQDEKGNPSWDDFVEKNYLQDYTEWTTRPYGRPKEFWEGHFCGKPLPETPEQFEAFFAHATEGIKTRSERMVKELRKRFPNQQSE